MRKTSVFQKLLHYIGHHKFYLAASLLCAVVSVVLTLYIPILTGRAVDAAIGAGRVDFDEIFLNLQKIAYALVCSFFVQWAMNCCNNKLTYEVTRSIRNDAFDKMQVLPLKFIDAHPTGELVSRLIADVEQTSDGLLMGFTQLFSGLVTIAATLGFMLSMNVKVTLVVILVTPISLLTAAYIAKKSYRLFLEQAKIRGEQTAFVNEMVGGQQTVRAYGYENEAMQQFDVINEKLQKSSMQATFLSSLVNPTTRFVNALVYMGVGLTGAIAVINGAMSVGGLSCFLSYANQYTKPFNEISGVVTELQNAAACAGRVFELIEEEPQTADVSNAVDLQNIKGNVQFEQVSFSYEKEKPLIEHMNLDVKAGQRVAIVGPTGCGKTTLINLLMRFYETDQGMILVDGMDIRQMTRKSLRAAYGMVLQDAWLFQGTIRENIAIGKPEASIEEIKEAARAAFAEEFIERLPDSYDTRISEDGGSLSEGERQLLMIARVMLLKPPMLILDEATSNVDTRTEIKVQKAFDRLMEGRTSFVVAHRLSTIRDADLILVMKDGKIIEKGTHENLILQGNFYENLYNSQFQR